MQEIRLRETTPEQQAKARGIIRIPEHAVLADALRKLREVETKNAHFRSYARLVAEILMIEATRNLPLTEIEITTPLATTNQPKLVTDIVYFVAILRAGLALWLPDFLPKSRVGTIGIVRSEELLSGPVAAGASAAISAAGSAPAVSVICAIAPEFRQNPTHKSAAAPFTIPPFMKLP